MSITILVELRSKPENVDKLKSTLINQFPETRAYNGFQSIEFHEDEDDPNHFMMIERWDSRSCYEKYRAWRIETGSANELADLLSQPLNIHYYNRIEE